MASHLDSGGTLDTLAVGLQLSSLKALAAKWFVDAFAYCTHHVDIAKAFRLVGIDLNA